MSQKTTTFDPGKLVFDWQAYDSHPHQRGMIWKIVFSLIIVGISTWAVITDPSWGWLTALAFLLVGGLFFWVHRRGPEVIAISVHTGGIFVNRTFFPKEAIEGFWFTFDETVAVVNLELRQKNHPVAIQMGANDPEFFRQNFEKMDLPELEDKKESVLDLWIRTLRLG